MNTRFSKYLATKGVSQSHISAISGVPKSTVSHFLHGHPVSSEKLQSLIHLSLEWLFFGKGTMLKDSDDADDLQALMAKKDEIISSRDVTITKKDAIISRLQELLIEKR